MKKYVILMFCSCIMVVQAMGKPYSAQNELNRNEIELQLKAIDALPNNQVKANKLIQFSRLLIQHGHIDASEDFTQQAIDIAKTLSERDKSKIYNEIGQVFVAQNDLTSALNYFYLAEKNALKTNDTKQLALCYNNIASIHFYLDHKGQAIHLVKKALVLTKRSSNEKELARLYGNLAFLYETVDLKQALYYSKLSNKLFSKQNLIKQSILSLVQLYRISDMLNLSTDADKYLNQAIDQAKDNQDYLTEIYFLVGQHELAQENNSEAQKILEKGLVAASNTNNKQAQIKIQNLLGNSYLESSPAVAVQHFKQSFHLAQQINDNLHAKLAAQYLNEAYVQLNNYPEAYKALEDQMKLDSMVQGAKIEEVILMNDIQIKNQELNLQKEKNTSLLNKNQKQLYASIVFFVILFFLFLTITSWIKWKELKKNQAFLKNEVARQTIHLKKANQIQLLMTKALVHDLKSPLIFLSRVANRIYTNPNLFSKEELKEVSLDLKVYSENLIVFIEEFVLWIKAKKEDFSPTITTIDLMEYSSKLYDLYNEPIVQNANQLTLDVIPMELHTDGQLLHIVVRNLIDNANKNTHNGMITLRNYEENNTKVIEISDTGSGMSEAKIKSLYALLDLEKIDESDEANQSLGYKIIMEFTKLMQCEIIISSKGTNVGSTIQLIFKN